ncbi:MAG: hypothetical protein HY647_02530 [Acidobacteria bacterium]|nr:hypothetical protein [Acidobacteriota bacterium]
MPKVPDFLEPTKERKAERVELEWRTVSYRSVALVGLSLVVAASIIVYLMYPEQIRRGLAKVFSGAGKATGEVFEQRQARFLNIEGNVRVKKANEVQWANASLDLPLEKGDVVQTSGDGMARLSFADGTIYTVRADTLIVVEENSSRVDANITNVSVQVNSGEVDLSTTKFQGESKIMFANAVARMGQDSRASVKNDPKAERSELTLVKGYSEVVRGTERVVLGAYEQVTFRGESGQMSRQRVMGPPLLLVPANQAPVVAPEGPRSEVNFSWTPVPAAKSYRLRISTSPIFSTLTYDRRASSSTVKVSGLPEGTYYWAVSSLDEKNEESQTSDANKFTLLRKLPEDEILLEVDNLSQYGNQIQIVGRTEPGARVIVNDEPVFAVEPDGTFKHFTQPFASKGANQITITAQNAKGQIATRRKTVYIQ